MGKVNPPSPQQSQRLPCRTGGATLTRTAHGDSRVQSARGIQAALKVENPSIPPLSTQRRSNSLLERLIRLALVTTSWKFNLVLLAIIVALSGLLALLLWQFAGLFDGFQGAQTPVSHVVVLASIISVIVGGPAIWFSDALITRIQQVERELRLALDTAHTANRAKTDFLANMSHEIRTPLNGVLGMAQVLERTELTADQRATLRVIHESGDLLMAIIGDILDLSRIEAGQISLDPVTQPVASTLADTVELFHARAQQNGNSLTWATEGPIPDFARYDATRTRQCLANLVSNAVKFTKGGKVSVTLSAEDRGDDWLVRIDVRDEGIGIAPEVQSRLFAPFEQATTRTARDFGGTGLGLAISRNLARLMGGDITLQSEPGAGSVFSLTFAAAKAEAPVAAPPAPEPAIGHDGLAGWQVLVVDDSAINRKVAIGLLGPLGCQTIEADGGQSALSLLEQGGIDLVLLDLHMPAMDGTETLSAIRALPGPVKNTPVIMLTADVLSARREDYLSMGAQGFLSKPLRREALMQELRLLQAGTG